MNVRCRVCVAAPCRAQLRPQRKSAAAPPRRALHAGIKTAGAGRSEAEARAPAIVEGARAGPPGAGAPAGPMEACNGSVGGASAAAAAPPLPPPSRVLVYGLAHESSGVPDGWAAGPGAPGITVTRLTRAEAVALGRAAAAAKRPGLDVAVASVHMGGNWGFSVDLAQRAYAHALVDAGFDVVHGHSSHHAKGFEVYRGKLILYGAGDLISDYEGIKVRRLISCWVVV